VGSNHQIFIGLQRKLINKTNKLAAVNQQNFSRLQNSEAMKRSNIKTHSF
jgi:hypothetical protein